MVIRFRCPNGHSIRCSDEQAGRIGKCRECRSRFVIPHPDVADFSEAHSAITDPKPAEPSASDSVVSAGEPAEPNGQMALTEAAKPKVIVFLCPNGHRLHGPSSLEGRPGKCPHCGALFRIPSHDDLPEEDEGPPPGAPVAGTEDTRLTIPDNDTESIEPPLEIGPDPVPLNVDWREISAGDSSSRSLGRFQDERDLPRDAHPLVPLFAKLWEQRSRGGCVELHLADGTTLVPERYSPELSRQKHAVFAVADGDGSYTLLAIAWDSITRVAVRQVRELPQGVFDEEQGGL
jgi:hypothetical protein